MHVIFEVDICIGSVLHSKQENRNAYLPSCVCSGLENPLDVTVASFLKTAKYDESGFDQNLVFLQVIHFDKSLEKLKPPKFSPKLSVVFYFIFIKATFCLHIE